MVYVLWYTRNVYVFGSARMYVRNLPAFRRRQSFSNIWLKHWVTHPDQSRQLNATYLPDLHSFCHRLTDWLELTAGAVCIIHGCFQYYLGANILPITRQTNIGLELCIAVRPPMCIRKDLPDEKHRKGPVNTCLLGDPDTCRSVWAARRGRWPKQMNLRSMSARRMVLRTIYGPVIMTGEWRRRNYHELSELIRDRQAPRRLPN